MLKTFLKIFINIRKLTKWNNIKLGTALRSAETSNSTFVCKRFGLARILFPVPGFPKSTKHPCPGKISENKPIPSDLAMVLLNRQRFNTVSVMTKFRYSSSAIPLGIIINMESSLYIYEINVTLETILLLTNFRQFKSWKPKL